MKSLLKSSTWVVLLLISLGFCASSGPRWGFFGHRRINRLAVFTLPPEMMVLYKPNIEWLTEHAPDPDRRRYALKVEAPRHYIDLDVWQTPDKDRKLTGVQWLDAMRRTDLLAITNRGDTTVFFDADAQNWAHKTLIVNGLNVNRSQYSKWYKRRVFEKEQVSPGVLAELTGRAPAGVRLLLVRDRLFEHGINPYFTERMLRRLTRAFEQHDVNRILKYSADIGHYIADGHVPLHTTENYNGQLTGQLGIHAFWESRIPELFADASYDFLVGKARYIKNKRRWIWAYVRESHRLVDSVLLLERQVRAQTPVGAQACFETRGALTVRTPCREFARRYQDAMHGMVERRMRAAILAVGSAWYTAWVDAGQPDLSVLAGAKTQVVVTDSLETGRPRGKILGRMHWD